MYFGASLSRVTTNLFFPPAHFKKDDVIISGNWYFVMHQITIKQFDRFIHHYFMLKIIEMFLSYPLHTLLHSFQIITEHCLLRLWVHTEVPSSLLCSTMYRPYHWQHFDPAKCFILVLIFGIIPRLHQIHRISKSSYGMLKLLTAQSCCCLFLFAYYNNPLFIHTQMQMQSKFINFPWTALISQMRGYRAICLVH